MFLLLILTAVTPLILPNVTSCVGDTAPFLGPFVDIENLTSVNWYYNDEQIIGGLKLAPIYTFGCRVNFNWPTTVGFNITQTRATDAGKYKAIVITPTETTTYTWNFYTKICYHVLPLKSTGSMITSNLLLLMIIFI